MLSKELEYLLAATNIPKTEWRYWRGMISLPEAQRENLFKILQTADDSEIQTMHTLIKEKTDLLQSRDKKGLGKLLALENNLLKNI
ncbi:MAG: hypothetical protein AAB362_00390 [Patescibacteria group bacterium]